MSVTGSVELLFGGDLRTFRLGISELLALQEKRGEGVFQIAARMQVGNIYVQDIQHIIRLGLIGADVEPKKAQSIVDDHVRGGTLAQCLLVAQAVLLNALVGSPDDPVGKAGAAAEAPEATASPPPTVTPTAP